MDLDLAKICRVCLNEGVMMSIFKVSVSKKMMSCASVQVWQNDGLPTQICNKCSAKLHISFQFKKQCEKSDAKLRQYIAAPPKEIVQPQQQIPNEHNIEHQLHQNQLLDAQQLTEPTHVYIECSQLLEMPQEPKFDAFVQSQAPPLTQINYNIQPQNIHPLGGYSLQTVGQVQVYNGAYSMPLQQMQNANIIQSHVIPAQMQLQPQTQHIIPQQQIIQQQTIQQEVDESKDKKKKLQDDVKIIDSNKQCSTCNKVFGTATKLSRHMKTHSTDMPYKCKVCNKAFSHSGNYKIHLRMHTDERPFRCTVCDKGCRQAQDLEKHMRTHTGERPHQCTLCTRAFSTSSNLIAHIRTHTGERPYVCCVCQKAFCQSNELTKHMRTHTGEKSHICDICHKGFNGSSTLIVHRRSHTGERPYVCRICSKGFAQSSCLVVHMKRHNGDKNFQCLNCDKAFVTSVDLKDHCITHLADKPFSCNMCNKSFMRAADLHRHAKTHVSNDINKFNVDINKLNLQQEVLQQV